LSSGGDNKNFRKRLAARAFAASAYYDSVISARLSVGGEGADGLGRHKTSLPLKFVGALRYGENPHQSAAFYLCPSMGGLPLPERLGGKEISFNNILDASAGLAVTEDLGGPSSCVVIKHTNPCGAAVARRAVDAYRNAFATDPVSAFGGSVVFGCGVDEDAASEIIKVFTDSVVAPSFTPSALAILKRKKNLLILRSKASSVRARFEFRSVFGGALVQRPDDARRGAFRVVTKKRPSSDEKQSLLFAATVAGHSKSNAVVLASGSSTLGVGSGCVSRIDAFRTALSKMRAGCLPPDDKIVLASDAFFPFDDIAREAAAAGVRAIIQPGGSIRDADSIRACDEAGISMVFTGVRHFKH
jgi:phosphoribosylaminoimidazolecarboxamide formyltransferase/IMP cyclohydrolase